MLRLSPIRTLLAIALLMAGVRGFGQVSAPAQIQNIQAHTEQDKVRVEISLTSVVQPSLITAVNPDRLVLDLPGTISEVRQKHVGVNRLGVKDVRFGLNAASPPVTRVVVDLDAVHSYSLSAEGTKIVLTITGTVQEAAKPPRRVPAAAATAPFGGMFRKKPELPSVQADRQVTLPPRPTDHPPAWEPGTGSAKSSSGSTTAGKFGDATVSAAHPKLGSLQSTTVYPSAEVASGTTSAAAIPEAGIVKPEGVVPVPTPANARAAVSTGSFQAASSSGGTSTTGVSPVEAAVKVAPSVAPASSEIALAAKSLTRTSPLAPALVVAAAPPPPVVATRLVPEAVPAEKSVPDKVVPEKVAQGAEKASPLVAKAKPATSAATVGGAGAVSTGGAAPTGALSANVPASAEGALSPDLAAAVEAGKIIEGTSPTTSFKVKHVAAGAAYLDGGRSSGLSEGMKLVIRDDSIKATSDNPDAPDPRVVAELEVVSVAETSAVTEIKSPKRPVKPGDLAYLSAEDEAALVTKRTLSSTRKYPMVLSFTEGDPLDEEVRVELPRPPQPSVNRTRLRLGIDYGGILDHGSAGLTSTQVGFSTRVDITRIGGTFWNLNGFWRGRMTQRSSKGQPTLQDLINRTYQISFSYQNPQSAWVAGFGRLFLPYATSLDTLDGGYFGRRFGHRATAGFFGGSTPDPTSWNYAPGRRMAGGFANFEGGSYEGFHYFSTTGGAASTLNGQFDRPFVFFENSFSYKRLLSLYSAVQADNPPGTPAVAAKPPNPAIPANPGPGAGLSRAFLTFRVQPVSRLSFDANYNYFRDVPAFDPSIPLVLLEKYLFQGVSFGVRAEVVKNVTLYTTLGESSRSGDKKNSLNQTYGATWNQIFHTGLRSDAHYSKFDSAFGAGSYESVSVSRSLMEGSRLEVQLGQQSFLSPIGGATNTKFMNSMFDMNISRHYLLQGGITLNRGNIQNYDQWFFGLGYRFDNREKK